MSVMTILLPGHCTAADDGLGGGAVSQGLIATSSRNEHLGSSHDQESRDYSAMTRGWPELSGFLSHSRLTDWPCGTGFRRTAWTSGGR